MPSAIEKTIGIVEQHLGNLEQESVNVKAYLDVAKRIERNDPTLDPMQIIDITYKQPRRLMAKIDHAEALRETLTEIRNAENK